MIKPYSIKKLFFAGLVLLMVVILFAVIDYFIHESRFEWGVPDYYYKDKIPAGFFWGVVGLFLGRKIKNIWLKSLIFSGVIATTLQVRYFLEGYDLSFVVVFLFFHFVILYVLSVVVFWLGDRARLSGAKPLS